MTETAIHTEGLTKRFGDFWAWHVIVLAFGLILGWSPQVTFGTAWSCSD